MVTTKHELEATKSLVQNRNNAHWVDNRYFQDSIYCLDSLTRPEKLTDEVLQDDLLRFPNTIAIR